MPTPPLNEWADVFELAPVSLSAAQQAQFKQLYQSLSDWNSKINVTRIQSLEDFWVKHVIDSWQLTPFIDEVLKTTAKPVNIIDIGSGGGFPALVLAITYPSLHVTAVDSVQKKTRVIEAIASETGLTNLSTIAARAEELAHQTAHREQYDIATARAVSDMPRLLEYTLPFVRPNGMFLAMKTEAQFAEEAHRIQNALATLGGVHRATTAYRELPNIPDAISKHLIIKIDKTTSTPNDFPRTNSQIQKAAL